MSSLRPKARDPPSGTLPVTASDRALHKRASPSGWRLRIRPARGDRNLGGGQSTGAARRRLRLRLIWLPVPVRVAPLLGQVFEPCAGLGRSQHVPPANGVLLPRRSHPSFRGHGRPPVHGTQHGTTPTPMTRVEMLQDSAEIPRPAARTCDPAGEPRSVWRRSSALTFGSCGTSGALTPDRNRRPAKDEQGASGWPCGPLT
jgi:hypothetical protein